MTVFSKFANSTMFYISVCHHISQKPLTLQLGFCQVFQRYVDVCCYTLFWCFLMLYFLWKHLKADHWNFVVLQYEINFFKKKKKIHFILQYYKIKVRKTRKIYCFLKSLWRSGNNFKQWAHPSHNLWYVSVKILKCYDLMDMTS